MQPDARAALFDLDDTLYPLGQFVRSGFRAAASHAAATWRVKEADAVRVLHDAYGRHRGCEFQQLQRHFALPDDAVETLVQVVRAHVPRIRLSPATRGVLRLMRTGWRLAVVTNGRPDIQARKIEALGVADLVDAVVFATATGGGEGKPAAAPFLEACARLDVLPRRAVFIGDDLRCDVGGARAVGMTTIWMRRSSDTPGVGGADAILRSLADVPNTVEQLLPPSWSRHAA